MSKKGPPFCVVGDCKRQAVYRHWLCKKCGRMYGNAPLDASPSLVFLAVYGRRPA